MSEPFFFIAMADPQLGRMPDDSEVGFDTSLWEEAIEHATRLQPAFVAVLGDLIQTPTNDIEASELLRIKRKLPNTIPIHLVSGNHDILRKPTKDSLNWYRQTFGKDWYSFKHGGSQFIVLNSTIIDEPGELQAEVDAQSAWLNATLQSNNGTQPAHTIILQHHPWFRDDPDEGHTSHSLPQPARHRHLEMFVERGVSAVFAGHYHANHVVRYGDIEIVAAGTLSDRRSDAVPGFEVVKVYEDRIEHDYYTLQAMPDRIDM
jgi:predicted MPP superfamily phosphohydrolase